jgi:hypothetical protein
VAIDLEDEMIARLVELRWLRPDQRRDGVSVAAAVSAVLRAAPRRQMSLAEEITVAVMADVMAELRATGDIEIKGPE